MPLPSIKKVIAINTRERLPKILAVCPYSGWKAVLSGCTSISFERRIVDGSQSPEVLPGQEIRIHHPDIKLSSMEVLNDTG